MERYIRSTGNLTTVDRVKGKGTAVIQRFLENTLVEFAKASKINIDFYRFFTQGERQISSFLTVVFSKFASNVLVEYPIQREWSKIDFNDSHGWLDFLCDFEGCRFIIEVKHEFMSSKSCKPTKRFAHKWIVADKQLACLDKFVDEHVAVCTKGVIRLSLTVVVFYERTTLQEDVHKNKERILSCSNAITSHLNPTPNWIGTWVLHRDLIDASSDKTDDRGYIWPAVKLVSHSYELVKQK